MDTYIKLERREPFYRHDCEHCRYRGSFVHVPVSAFTGAPRGQGQAHVYDVYVHPADDGDRIVKREGNEPGAYASFPRKLVNTILAFSNPAWDEWDITMSIVKTAKLLTFPRHNAKPLPPGYEPEPFETVRWSESYYGGLDSSRRRTWVIKFGDGWDHPDGIALARQTLEGYFPATHCQHSHDCCGNWYADKPRITRLPSGLWLVSQRQAMNI